MEKIQKFIRNWKKGFLKQQHKQKNNSHQNNYKNKNIIHTDEIIIFYISQ